MTTEYNRLYNIKIKDEKKIPATASYLSGQNVCFLAPQKAQMKEVVATKIGIGVDASNNFLDVSGNSVFRGNATFNTIAKCSTAPVSNEDLANKNYVDNSLLSFGGSISTLQDKTQFITSTLSPPPTASTTTISSNLDLGNNSLLTGGIELTSTELGYLNNVSSNIQTQINTINNNASSAVSIATDQTISGAKTFTNDGTIFNTTSASVALTNPFFTAFTGFTAPVNPNLVYLVSAGTATGNYTNNGWTWNRGNTQNEIVWSNGNSGLEYYGAPPPGYSYCIFNRATAGSTFTLQQTINFTAGKNYVMKFWSYWGWVNIYSGGSRTGRITLSVGNSTDTYVYNDQDTRVAITWRQHTFRFSVSTTGSSFIRFTATDTATAGTPFPWAIGGITIREYNAVRLTDTSQTLNSFVSGDFSFQRNLFTQNLFGSGDFGTTSGRGTFFAPSPNINCLCINNNTFNSGTSFNCIAIGKASYFVANGASDCINIGNYQNLVGDTNQVSKVGNQMIEIGNNHEGASANGSILIGHYIRQLKPTIGYSVAIGNQIGAGGTDNTITGYGAGSRTIAIGYGIFSGNADPFSRPSPDYSVMIGHLAGRNNGDFYNVGIGSFALNSMNGVAGTIPGNGTTQFNTALGYQAGRNQTDLNRCVLIGANADNTANSLTDTIALGYDAKCGANFACSIGSGVVNNVANSVRLGRSADRVDIDGTMNVAGKSAFAGNVDVSGNLVVDGNITGNTNTFLKETKIKGGDLTIANADETRTIKTNLTITNSIDFTNIAINAKNNSAYYMYSTTNELRGEWRESKLQLTSASFIQDDMKLSESGGTITGTTTITKPYNQVRPVESTSTAYTITLPTITAGDLGHEILFRKVKQGGTAQTISFIGNGTQKIYNLALTGGATAQGLMTSTIYNVRLVALLDTTTGGGVYAWFATQIN